ncbi:MAG: M48 family metalloprotease [Pseudomonadales bacterium]
MKRSLFKQISTHLLATVCLLWLTSAPTVQAANTSDLPDLGNAGASLFSKEKEYALGQAWLRSFRSQVRTVYDPILSQYLESLIYRLAEHSELDDRRLELVIVGNKNLNAFAVPGGVIGVHDGLLLHAKSEGELAAVLSHELAHLSQKHFARGVEKARRSSIPNMLALLGSMVIAATAGGDAGMAALSATQALSLQSRLNFSRQNELEADRLGMQTMARAGMDPNDVPAMFERMQRASRYYRIPPEFLLTHPVSETRISDSKNRARDYPSQIYTADNEYDLMRARVLASYAENAGQAIKRFKSDLKGDTANPTAARYGLVLAYTDANKLNSARAALKPLLLQEPRKIVYLLAQVDIEIRAGRIKEALSLLEQQLAINPSNHPLTMAYANALLKEGRAKETEMVLLEHVELHPHDEHVWYLLAETHGLAGNIPGVHQARAEYFILNGVFDEAERQLIYALKLVRGDYLASAKINERMRSIEEMREAINI